MSLLLLLTGALLTTGQARSAAPADYVIKPVVPPRQLGELLRGQVIEAGGLVNVDQVRFLYGLDGTGYTAAVLDTGIRSTHTDFAGKVVAQQNYTADNGGNPNNAADGEGHGTNVSGIIMANGVHRGMAPGANVAALKVLDNNGSGGSAGILAALDWVIANRVTHNITVVNMSLGDGGNYTGVASDAFLARFNTLRAARVAVCVAAGNEFFEWDSEQGMSWPAIHSPTVSVGAVYDADIGGVSYGGAIAFTTGSDRICPFSQRLHPNVSAVNRTDVFAPGAELTSAGITSDTSSSASHGTSQATPVVAGVVLLLQQYVQNVTGSLPTVDQLENWIRAGAVTINDGDDEDDSVVNTGLNYPRIDALAALQAAELELSTSVSPTNLSAGSISPDSISLNWTDNNTNELGFAIERAVGAGPVSNIVFRGPNTTAYLDQGLNSNTSYTYRVRAFTPLGNTAYTNDATALTFPEDPASLTVTTPAAPAGRSQLNLSWTDNSDQPSAFQIYRSLNPLNIVNLHAVTAVGATTFADTGLEPETTYYYRVRAINARGPSGFSGAAQGTTLSAPATAPTALTATVESSTRISLRWDDTSNNETGFRLERVRGTSFLSLAGFTTFALGVNVTSYADTNLTPNTTYTYRVFTVNASGDSLPSAEAGGATFPEVPADPGAVTVAAESDASLRIDWLDNSSNETGFRIERSSGGGFTQVGAVNANVATFTDTGLLSNATYTYRVRAVNGVSVSAPSATADGLTLPATPPALTVTPQSSTQVRLAWTDASSSPSAFKVERKSNGGYTEIALTNVGDVSYTDASASPNISYTYRIRATNASGDSEYSAQATGTTPPNPPSAPTGLSVTVVSQSALLLNWTDASSDETAFKIERSTDGVSYIVVATADANSTGYLNNGLTANTTYWFRVKATNAGGDSAASNTVSKSTLPNLPAAPSGLSVSVISQTELRLNWSDASSD
ncbi:MAG: fibronectin type III domain-containing protein, partial [Actinomycetota bacterium]